MSEISRQRHVVLACFLGWTLDAFDFFIMVFVLSDIARTFSTGITTITWAITLTLAVRAIGALIFGRLADRFGRKPTLIFNVLAFSAMEFATGFAPTLTAFMVLRGLYGIAMGGEWGVGASLTMESIPQHWRGTVSGILQAGYSVGYLLASIVFFLAYTTVGWRGMFMIGAAPALLVLYIRARVPESPDWQARARRPRVSLMSVARKRWPLFIYAILVMTAFNLFAHSTQDLYPNAYLRVQNHLSVHQVGIIAIIYNIGAILGCVLAGTLSQRFGRRRVMVGFALAALVVIPFWSTAATPVGLAATAFAMQFVVQAAFGVVPAHLNEISPPEVRGTFPGFTYQLGNLLAAANATIQSGIADRMQHNYSVALASTAAVGAISIALLIGFGKEARHLRMNNGEDTYSEETVTVPAHRSQPA